MELSIWIVSYILQPMFNYLHEIQSPAPIEISNLLILSFYLGTLPFCLSLSSATTIHPCNCFLIPSITDIWQPLALDDSRHQCPLYLHCWWVLGKPYNLAYQSHHKLKRSSHRLATLLHFSSFSWLCHSLAIFLKLWPPFLSHSQLTALLDTFPQQ